MAASVPGRGRSHTSAMAAAGVSPGSMTTMLAPFARARLSACHCGGSAAYGLRPTMSAQRVLSISSPLPMASPVIRSLNARHPPQRSWFIIQLGEPKARSNSASATPRLKCALLTAPQSAVGPYRSRTASIASAILIQCLVPRHPLPLPPHPAAPCASWDKAPGPDDRSAPATPGSPSRRTPPATPDVPGWATPASPARPPP